MSYYLLPRKQCLSTVTPIYSSESFQTPFISHSLIHYIKKANEQIDLLMTIYDVENAEINVDTIYKIINPYEFVYSIVPGSKFSVSKIKTNASIFYTLMEIINLFNIFEAFNKNINMLYCTSNNNVVIDCVNIFRENYNDVNYQDNFDKGDFIPIVGLDESAVDFLYIEINNIGINNYILNFINALRYMLKYQNACGTCIMRVESLHFKPILDVVYFLTSMYEKVYIIKPNISNSLNDERFIICKNFLLDYSRMKEVSSFIKTLNDIIIDIKNGKNIISIINSELPYYFLNKLEESNIIIGQLQLEHLDQVINTIKNKNRDNKIETLKKNNIQKSIQWCEKNKIPYNKFVDKLNIFLPLSLHDNSPNFYENSE
jgi:hypothetical protein